MADSRQKRMLAAGVLALAALLLGLWWATRSDAGDPAAPGVAAVADVEPGELAQDGSVAREERPSSDARSTAAVERPLPATDSGGNEGIPVRVVLASDGIPLAGVDVLYFDPAGIDAFELRELTQGGVWDLTPALARSERKFRTDAGGIARVPHPRGEGLVGAAHAGCWAQAPIAPETDAEVRLTLEPEFAIEVQLRGPSEILPGIAVSLLRTQTGGRYFPAGRQLADASGRVRFEHLGQLVRMVREHSLRILVAAEVLNASPIVVEVAPESWPDRPVEIVLPPTGQVRIELVGSGGPLPAAARERIERSGGVVWLGLSREELGRQIGRGSEPPVQGTRLVMSGKPSAVATVGLGLELTADANLAGWGDHEITFLGPTKPGETVDVRLPLETEALAISGRLIDERGDSVASRVVEVVFQHARSARQIRERRATDDDGRFSGLGQGHGIDAGEWGVLFRLPDEPQRTAWVALPLPLPAHVVDLGDVTLTVAPLLVSGRIVDDRGQPVRAAPVVLETLERHAADARRSYWGSLPEGSWLTSNDGRFELRSWVPTGELRLSVTRKGYVAPEPLVLQPPRSGVEIVLTREASIEGRLLSAVVSPQKWVQAELWRGTTHVNSQVKWGDGGAFRFGNLAAGTYSLHLRPWHGLPGVHEIHGIAVRAFEPTQLEHIDLDRLLRSVRFDVRGPDGVPVEGARFSLKARGSDSLVTVTVQRDAEGRYLLRSFEPMHAVVRIEAPGFVPVSLADVSTDQHVELAPALLVRIVLAGGLPHLPEPWSLHVRRLDESGGDTPARFDARGEALVRLSRAGRWSISLGLMIPGDTQFRALNGLTWSIEVVDTPREQVFESPPLTPEFLDEIARRMR